MKVAVVLTSPLHPRAEALVKEAGYALINPRTLSPLAAVSRRVYGQTSKSLIVPEASQAALLARGWSVTEVDKAVKKLTQHDYTVHVIGLMGALSVRYKDKFHEAPANADALSALLTKLKPPKTDIVSIKLPSQVLKRREERDAKSKHRRTP